MKFKFLALTLCMASLSCIHLQAQSVKDQNAKHSSMKGLHTNVMSKDGADFTFFGASDVAPFTLTGSPTPTFVPIPFTQHHISHGKAVKSNATSDQFLLRKGTYLILFTGTFTADDNPSTLGDLGIFFDIALQVGSNTIFLNTDSHEPLSSGFDATGVSCVSKVIEVDKPTPLSIVARDTTDMTTVDLTTRSISIIKLDD
jgi:hypothetical protein